jgi:NAD/NADP transhydrogenase alpha subunit
VQLLVKKGFKVQIEAGAGDQAKFTNKDYENAGALVMVRFLINSFPTK